MHKILKVIFLMISVALNSKITHTIHHNNLAPVVQWIEQRSPKPQIPVRIWAGAPHGALALRFIVAADFGYAVYEGQDGFGTGAGFETFGGVEFV